jgi:predicted transcriptional regulator
MKTRRWTLFTNHAAIFFHLLEHPDATIRRIADELDLAERTVVGVLGDLREDGYLLARREGRHNVYQVNAEGAMKRPAHAGYTMREFFAHVQSELNRVDSTVEKHVDRENSSP